MARWVSSGWSSPKLCHSPSEMRGQLEPAASGAAVGHVRVTVGVCGVQRDSREGRDNGSSDSVAGHSVSGPRASGPTEESAGIQRIRFSIMELRHLQHFVAVAEDQHFTRAAERLLVSQSGLSASIRALERELQAPLFVRTTRRVDAHGGRSRPARRGASASLPRRAAAHDAVAAVQGLLRGSSPWAPSSASPGSTCRRAAGRVPAAPSRRGDPAAAGGLRPDRGADPARPAERRLRRAARAGPGGRTADARWPPRR